MATDFSGLNSMYTDIITTTGSSQTTAKLQQNIQSANYENATDNELMDACKEFEAYFLEQMFKEMEKTIPKSEESTDSGLVDYFKDSTLQEITKQTTENQGLGLAQMLYEQMKRNYEG